MPADIANSKPGIDQAKETKDQLALAFWQQTIRAGREVEPARQEAKQEKPTETDGRQLSL